MGLLKISRNYLLNTDTLTFIRSDGWGLQELDIPYYLWEYATAVDRVVTTSGQLLRRAKLIRLNNIEISLGNKHWGGNDNDFSVWFKIRDDRHRINVQNSAWSRDLNVLPDKVVDGQNLVCFVRCDFRMESSFSEDIFAPESYRVMFDDLCVTLPELVNPWTQHPFWSETSFGLAPVKYTIRYRRLNLYECYAYMLGNCAILLKDDLSFDSFVSLMQVSKDTLLVHKFLYTINGKAVKAQIVKG